MGCRRSPRSCEWRRRRNDGPGGGQLTRRAPPPPATVPFTRPPSPRCGPVDIAATGPAPPFAMDDYRPAEAPRLPPYWSASFPYSWGGAECAARAALRPGAAGFAGLLAPCRAQTRQPHWQRRALPLTAIRGQPDCGWHGWQGRMAGPALYGNSGCCVRPVVSGNPQATFMFWIAWPAAPFTRLSMTDSTMARPSIRSAKTEM